MAVIYKIFCVNTDFDIFKGVMMKKFLYLIFFLFVILPLTWFFVSEFEGKDPAVTVKLPSHYLKRSYEMELSISDHGTGLRGIKVSLVQDSKEKVLLQKEYTLQGYEGFFMGSGIFQDRFEIPIESWKYGMNDGEACIKIHVSDYSWRGWNKGNILNLEKKVVIDTKPPDIEVLTKRHNISRGGAGLIIYRLFEDGTTSGVQAGEHFYPGYSGMFDDKNIFSAFFALSYEQGPGTELFVKAVDPAGNVSKRGFYHYIKEKKFRTDTLNISDDFLALKMPEFNLGAKENDFQSSENPFLKKFIYINQTIRKKNIKEILKPAAQTENNLLWKEKFLRLPGSASRARFADHRIYKYNGKEIDRQVHMGVDLASVAHAPIPAANSGKIIGAENIGIFGNCVLIDHGFGLCSSYAHLSSIALKIGDVVQKGDIIGKSGTTGLAGGDHLHFALSIHNMFVNPIEWWDKAWIKNNITSKIEFVNEIIGAKK